MNFELNPVDFMTEETKQMFQDKVTAAVKSINVKNMIDHEKLKEIITDQITEKVEEKIDDDLYDKIDLNVIGESINELAQKVLKDKFGIE